MFFDSHVHSCHSHDSVQTLAEICASAREQGLKGVAITDHADVWFWEKDQLKARIAASTADARAADGKDGVRVLTGVELAGALHDVESARELLALTDYDIVLGSVHGTCFEDWSYAYSRIDFGSAPAEKLHGFLSAYFRDTADLAAQGDFDALAHLTCPLRYINGKYRRGVSLEPYLDTIDGIFRSLIHREKALEVNTSGLGGAYGLLMPDEALLRRYYALGGRLVTLGSDGHVPERVGKGLREAASTLQAMGFPGYCYYEQRQRRFIPW